MINITGIDFFPILIYLLIYRKAQLFPDANTKTTMFYGQIYDEIPVITVRVSKNNTIVAFNDAKGEATYR